MKAGRVISGDEHEARTEAQRLLDEARAEAQRLVGEAEARAAQLEHDAGTLAGQLVREARAEAERAVAQAQHARSSQGPATGASAHGAVDEVTGLVIRATVPGVALGELVRIDTRDRSPLAAEVVGFRGEQAVLLPLGELAGVAPASAVWRTGAPLTIACSDELLGRVLDGVGAPIDGGAPLAGEVWAVDRAAPSPLSRPPITAPQPTGSASSTRC